MSKNKPVRKPFSTDQQSVTFGRKTGNNNNESKIKFSQTRMDSSPGESVKSKPSKQSSNKIEVITNVGGETHLRGRNGSVYFTDEHPLVQRKAENKQRAQDNFRLKKKLLSKR
jgi:hypothetical protein